MSSNIDATQPPASNPTTAAMRANMAAAKAEIEALQAKQGHTRKVFSIKGETILDFGASDFLPSGASFSGPGSYGSAGRIAVQSTGVVTHNPTGWHDGTPCLEFVPGTNTTCELRLHLDNANTNEGHALLNFNDPNGVALDYSIEGVNTDQTNISINLEFSDVTQNPASGLFPANKASFPIFNNDSSGAAQYREFAGRKYTRFRFDSTATDAKCGNWPGKAYKPNASGTGSDYAKPVNYLRFTFNKFMGQTIKLKRLMLGGFSTACVVLMTDNATPDTLSQFVAPLIAKHQIEMAANNAVATFQASAKALERFKRFYAAGWEINGNDVIDRALGATITDQPTMQAAIADTLAYQASQGWYEGSKVWIANNNSSSYLMQSELALAGYVANRNGASEGRYCFPEGGMPERYLIPGNSIDNGTLATIQPLIDRCEEYGATIWLYFHNVLSKAQIDADRTNNIMAVSGAPVAVTGGQTVSQYRAAAVALGNAVGNATVTYLDQRVGTGYATALWFEDLKQIIDYIGARQAAGALVTRTPSNWARDVNLL